MTFCSPAAAPLPQPTTRGRLGSLSSHVSDKERVKGLGQISQVAAESEKTDGVVYKSKVVRAAHRNSTHLRSDTQTSHYCTKDATTGSVTGGA